MEIAELQTQVRNEDTNLLWVFAYGSLCWKPGFKFHKAVTGSVKGYQRRFWQGNITHRGTKEQPGRVATLVEGQGVVYGVSFAISGEAAIPYLSQRECTLGGYQSHITTFYPKHGDPFKVLVYVATLQNPYWLGYADERTIAHEIITCTGPSGSNVEYVIRLANFMREHFSDQHDPHLFKLEEELLALVTNKRMCLKSLMGTGEGCVKFIQIEKENVILTEKIHKPRETFQYSLQIQGTKSAA